MSTSITKKRMALGVIAATLGASFTLGSGSGPVSADPTQLNALVGIGSDTTQDVMNALSGFNFGQTYLPVNSGAPAFRTFISFDASPSQSASGSTALCITPKIDGPTFTRPNGSGNGRQALYQTTGSTWIGKAFTKDNLQILPVCPVGPTGITTNGAIDFARSSSSGSGTGTDTVFIPFARDAMTFASYRPGGGAPVTTLSRQTLNLAFTSATRQTVPDPGAPGNGNASGVLTIIPCGIQTGSGTHSFWRGTFLGIATDGLEAPATNQCTPNEAARFQESKGDQLKARGDVLAAGGLTNFVVVVGYSVAAYIAQFNGVSNPNGFDQIQIGSLSGNLTTGPGTGYASGPTGSPAVSAPVAGIIAPVQAFYNLAGIGRDVFNVFPRGSIVNTGTGALLTNPTTALFADANPAAPDLPVGSGALNNTSKICQEGARLELFGFAQIANCGNFAALNRPWDLGSNGLGNGATG